MSRWPGWPGNWSSRRPSKSKGYHSKKMFSVFLKIWSNMGRSSQPKKLNLVPKYVFSSVESNLNDPQITYWLQISSHYGSRVVNYDRKVFITLDSVFPVRPINLLYEILTSWRLNFAFTRALVKADPAFSTAVIVPLMTFTSAAWAFCMVTSAV